MNKWVLFISWYFIIPKEVFSDFGKEFWWGCFRIDTSARTFDRDNEYKLGIIGWSISPIRSDGMSHIFFKVYIFIGSFVWNLRGSCFTGDIVSNNSSSFRKTISDTIYEHCCNCFWCFFFDDTSHGCWYSFYDFSIRISNFFNDIRLHIYSSVCEYRICCCHLKECCIDTLSEWHRKKLDSRPFFIVIDLREYFTIYSKIGFFSESKFPDIPIEKGTTDFFDDIDHTNVTRPIESIGIGIVSKTLRGNIGDSLFFWSTEI